jgi:hypothetical protein
MDPPPTLPARYVLDKLFMFGEVDAESLSALSREALARAVSMSRETVDKYLRELAGFGFVRLPEGSGSAPAGVELVLERLEMWGRQRLILVSAPSENPTANAGLLSGDPAAMAGLSPEHPTTASRAQGTAAAVGVDEDAELKVLGEEARRLLAQAGVPMSRVLMDEVIDELRKGSTLADFLVVRRELAAGPSSMRAWRTGVPILARLRRERMGAAGLIAFPAVGAL